MLDPAPLPRPWNVLGDSLGELLDARAERAPERAYVIHVGDDGAERPIDLRATRRDARRAAAGLVAHGVRPGDRVLLVLPTGPAFIDSFFGVGYAGAAAVPVYPPARLKGLGDYEQRLARLIGVAQPRVIVADARVRLVVEAAAFRAGCRARVLEPAAIAAAGDADAPLPGAAADDVALVQFSSGSTGDPRGVVLTHRQVLSNVAAAMNALAPHPDAIMVSWLPLYHDMGLLGGLLMPLFVGERVALLSPQAFLLDPKRWLWTIHRHRAACSTAPNFAYQLVASRLDERELEGLDLSCWRWAMNGAEPIHPSTLEAFAARLAPYGFRREALMPVYGLAEVALAVSFHDAGARPVRYDAVDADALVHGEARPAPADAPARQHVGLGRPLPGFAVRIVDEQGRALPERRIGEIHVKGPSVMRGYLDDPEATRAALVDGWLRTGDLGYVADGDLFVVGRHKDLIVKAGRKWAPQDLERAAESVEGVRKGCVAAFGVPDPASGSEAVVVVAETREPAERHGELARRVGERVSQAAGVAPDHVTLLAPGALPKTSSGKLQRGRTRERWLAGELHAPEAPGLLANVVRLGRAIAQRTAPREPT